MEKTMKDVFLEKVQNYPHLNSIQTCDSKNLFMMDEGIYILDDNPAVGMIETFPRFKGEFGLILINDIWLLSISYKKETYIPAELDNYIKTGIVQFFAHSHPNDGSTANLFPSFPDLETSDSIDHKIYIVSIYGITEIDITNAENLKFLDIKWSNYLSDIQIPYEEYMQNQFKVYMSFMEYIGCKLEVISFDNYEKIDKILNSKKLLQHEFWNKIAGSTPFPGKKL